MGNAAPVDAFAWRVAPAPAVAEDEDRVLIVFVVRLAVIVVPVQVGPFWVTESGDEPPVAPVLTGLA